MEPADIMKNHRVENDDSNGQETLPLEMLRFLSKHFSRHCNPVVYLETILKLRCHLYSESGM